MKKLKYLIVSISLLFTTNLCCQTFFGIHGGIDYGLGGQIRFGQPEISIEIGAGVLPIIVFWSISSNFGYNKSYIKFYMSPSIGGAISFAVSNPGKKNQFSIKFSGVYNVLMGPGVGGGIDFLVSKGENKNVWLSAGILYFPDAYDTLLDELIKDEHLFNITRDDISSVLVNFRPYIGITLEL